MKKAAHLLLYSMLFSFSVLAGLESPSNGSTKSGIGLIRGWVCDAENVSIKINNREPVNAVYGNPRRDTLEVCGDTNNGFEVLWNWNLLGDGSHEVTAYADGIEIGSSNFNVVTLKMGEPFVRGLSGQYVLTNFPVAGRNTTVSWSQEDQDFVISSVCDALATDPLISDCNLNQLGHADTIVYEIDTAATIDIGEISSVISYPVTIEGDIASWEQPFWDSFKSSGQYGSYQIVDGELTIVFQVDRNGKITAFTKSDDNNDHLYIFLNGGMGDDIAHSGWLYRLTRTHYWNFNENGLLTGNVFNDNEEYSSAPMSQINYFTQNITHIFSRLANHQMDYSWFDEEKNGEWQRENNANWSPIASNPDQNAVIMRSFDINTEQASSGAYYLLAWADNGMYSETRVEGLDGLQDYYFTYHSDVLECDSEEGWCKAWNEDCCAIGMINKGDVPSRVTMNAYTTWSDVMPAIEIAVFGDISTYNHSEYPSPGDDGNPHPIRSLFPSAYGN